MKRRNVLFRLVAVCSSTALLLPGEAAAAPGFPNPVFTTMPNAQGVQVPAGNPDPGMMLLLGGYATVSTGTRNYDSQGVPGNDHGCGFPVRFSVDRRSWSDIGCVFLSDWPDWASGGYEAPQMYVFPGNDVVVVFAAIHRIRKSRCLGVARANSRVTDFDAHENPLLCSNDTYQEDGQTKYASLIGPTLFTDRDGSRYLLYKWDTPAENKIRIRRLADPNNLYSFGNPVTILSGTQYAQDWENGGVEAPSLMWNGSDGLYYLFYSGGFYQRETYAVGVARASSVLGGAGPSLYSKAPAGVNPILRGDTNTAFGNKFCGPGSADITWTPNEGWLIWYEAKIGNFNPTDCRYPPRYLMMDQMSFTKPDPRGGGRPPWPAVNPTT